MKELDLEIVNFLKNSHWDKDIFDNSLSIDSRWMFKISEVACVFRNSGFCQDELEAELLYRMHNRFCRDNEAIEGRKFKHYLAKAAKSIVDRKIEEKKKTKTVSLGEIDVEDKKLSRFGEKEWDEIEKRSQELCETEFLHLCQDFPEAKRSILLLIGQCKRDERIVFSTIWRQVGKPYTEQHYTCKLKDFFRVVCMYIPLLDEKKDEIFGDNV